MSLWISDSGATTAEIERGVKAAEAVITAAGFTVSECYAAVLKVSQTPINQGFRELSNKYSRELAAWSNAEEAAFRAAFEGWARYPEFAVLTYE